MTDKLDHILDKLEAEIEMSLTSTCDDWGGGIAEARDVTSCFVTVPVGTGLRSEFPAASTIIDEPIRASNLD